MQYQLLQRRTIDEDSDSFVANLSEVEIMSPGSELIGQSTRLLTNGSITAKSDRDLVGKLSPHHQYVLFYGENGRYDFEVSQIGESVRKIGERYLIVTT